jgi:hypothetical protein
VWTLRWKETNGEARNCSIDEEFVNDTLIYICMGGVRLDEIEVIGPNGPVRAWSMIQVAQTA